MKSRVWQELRIYQSADLVQSGYYRRFHAEMMMQRAQHIRHHFQQGESYFRSASDADSAVKPLILYYGCLALARGLIIFLNTATNSEIRKGHGLREERWDSNLARDGDMLKLPLRFSEGTFSDLMRATRNGDYGWNNENGAGPARPLQHLYRFELMNSRSFVLEDILSRIPSPKRTYESVTQRRANCIETQSSRLEGNTFSSSIVDRYGKNKSFIDEIESRFGSYNSVSVERLNDSAIKISWPFSTATELLSSIGVVLGPVTVFREPDYPC